MEKEMINQLIDTAIYQLKYSYTPYSNFKVGAALLAKNGQVMMEFCNPETFQVILAVDKEHYNVYTLKELLPLGFGPSNLA